MSEALDHFDALHADHPDPWGATTRWYERRKRALTLAALPRQRYGCVFEPGCSIGALSAGLAPRCDRLWCWDPSPHALARAARRLSDQPHVRLTRAALPAPLPPTALDLVVISEMGYYLTAAALDESIDAVAGALTPGGEVLACHWRRRLGDGHQSGDAVHAAIGARLGLPRVVHVEDPDFVIDLWSAEPLSPAQREGLR